MPLIPRARQLLLVLCVVAVSLAPLGDSQRQLLAGNPCPPLESGLFGILEPTAPLVIEACRGDRSSTFLAELKTLLAKRAFDQSGLWITNAADGSEASLAVWRNGRVVSFVTGGPWAVPDDPAWTEDPFDNLSWRRRYQSLSWLMAAARGYREGDAALGEQVRRYVLDWISDNDKTSAQSSPAWYDHTVAWRTDALMSMWDVLLKVMSSRDLAAVFRLLEEQGSALDGYLSEKRFVGHNHNLFHAMSLFNLATHLPELRHSAEWKADARRRVDTLLPEMVDASDGVSTEQAASYHYLALDLFSRADDYLSQAGDGLDQSQREAIAQMTFFAALLPDPNGVLPAIGDTNYGAVADLSRLDALRRQGLTTPEATFIETSGASGTRPPDAAFFSNEGYAIFRPSYGEVGPWRDDLHLVVEMAAKTRPHGHDDAMNVLLAAHGEQLLIDSGGPYEYGEKARSAFVGAAAHNTVIVDHAGYSTGDVSIERTTDTPEYSLISGSHENSPDVHHARSVILIKPSLVIVIDDLHSLDGAPHHFDLLYHLPPQARVEQTDAGARVTVDEAGVGLSVATSQTMATSVIFGQQDPLLGWVATSIAVREPAPVLDFAQDGTDVWFVTVIDPQAAASVVVPSVSVDSSFQGKTVLVTTPDGQWQVTIPVTGSVSVSTSSAAATQSP